MAELGRIELETLTQLMSLVEAFRAFDADKDGLIDSAELGGIMASLGYNLSVQEIKAMIMQGDKNNDGMLSIEEFLDINTKDLEVHFLGPFRKAIQGLDFDAKEFVNGAELCEILGNAGSDLSFEVCKSVIAAMDTDGDGFVSSEDFKLILCSCLSNGGSQVIFMIFNDSKMFK